MVKRPLPHLCWFLIALLVLLPFGSTLAGLSAAEPTEWAEPSTGMTNPHHAHQQHAASQEQAGAGLLHDCYSDACQGCDNGCQTCSHCLTLPGAALPLTGVADNPVYPSAYSANLTPPPGAFFRPPIHFTA